MKKTFLTWIILGFAILINEIGLAHANGEFRQKSERLVAKLHKYFPNVKGTVVSVRDDNIFIDIGIEQQIAVGAQLALLQEGIEIVDPRTKKVLGKYEKQVGAIQIIEILDQFSVAKILWMEPGTEVVQGSNVAGFPGRIKIAVLPVLNLTEKTIHTLSAYDLFVNTIKSDNRFAVFDEADIKAAALKAGISPENITQESALSEVNIILHAHNFLRLELQPGAEDIIAQAKLLSDSGEVIGSVQEIVYEYAELLQPVDSSPPEETQSKIPDVEPSPQAKVDQQQTAQDKFWRSDAFKLKAHKFAVGDLTGDGKNEMVVATRTDLHILVHGIMGVKDNFLLQGKIKGYKDALILALGVGDINQNGRAEIFVTTLRTISAEVRVFEYTDGKFKEIWNTKGLVMRVIHTPAGKTLLIGQKTTSLTTLEFLSGKISEYTWNGKDYSREKRLDVPGRVKIFGFTLADVDKDGRDEVLFYDKFDRVDMFQGGQRRWRSRSYEPYKMNVLRKGEDEKKVRKIPGRIELTDLGTDTDMRLILFNNLRPFKVVTGLPIYNGSRFLIFRWNGEKFVEEFQSEEFASYIGDYAVADIDNDGKQEVALAMVLKGDNFFRTPQSQIMVYELE